MRNFFLKSIAFTLGTISAFLILEMILRLAGYCSYYNPSIDIKDRNKPIIACIGDSFTYSSGVPRGSDYPSQLQKLVGEKYNVINLGHPGENSRYAVKKTQDLLKKNPPVAIILQIGPANNWNLSGYSEFLSKNNEAFSFLTNLKLFFFDLKAVRLLRLIKKIFEDKGKSIVSEKLDNPSKDIEIPYSIGLYDILNSFTKIDIPKGKFSFLDDFNAENKSFINTLDKKYIDTKNKELKSHNNNKIIDLILKNIEEDNIQKAYSMLEKALSEYPSSYKLLTIKAHLLMQEDKIDSIDY